MLLKHFPKRIVTLGHSLSFSISSSLHESKDPKDHKNADQHIPISKHNPHGIRDLRGFHNLDKLTEAQRDYSHLHSTQYHYNSAYHLFSLLPNSLARKIGQLVPNPKSTIASDSVHLPKIYSGGVPIYDCIDSANNYIIINKMLTRLAPFSIILMVPEPAMSLLLYGLGYFAYRQLAWKLPSDLVIKAELVPSTEEVVYQKISSWGSITTNRVKVQDLELSNLEELFGDSNPHERSVRGLINKQVAFKIRGSSELLLFESNGIWHEEGLNHPLLV